MKKKTLQPLVSTLSTAILAAAGYLVVALPASANTATWKAVPGTSANTNWSDNLNWTNTAGGNPGSTNNDLIFGGVGSVAAAGTINNVVDTSHSILSLTFTNAPGQVHNAEIPSGVSLTNLGTLTVGVNNAANSYNTVVTVSGGGTLVSTGATFNVKCIGAASTGGTATFNLSGLTNFVYNNSGGTITVASAPSGSEARGGGVFSLAGGSNNLTVGTIAVALGTGNVGPGGTLNLGAGTNIINVGTVNIAAGKINTGKMAFLNSTGGLKLRGVGGTDSDRANFTLGNRANTGTGTVLGSLVWNGHPVDVKAGTMAIGVSTANQSGETAVGILQFDAGTVDVTTINLAACSGNSGATARGFASVGGTGMLVVSNISLVNQTLGTSIGALTNDGGSIFCSGNIFKTTAAGTASVIFNSGLIDMQPAGDATAGSIVGDTVSVGSVGVAVITNATGVTASSALTVDVNGIIAGSALISSPSITVNSGGQINGATIIDLGTGGTFTSGGFNLASGQTLRGAGTVNGSFTQNTGATINVGTNGTTAALNFNNDLTLNAQGNLALHVSSPGANDTITVSGNLTLNGTNNVSLTALGGTFVNGTYTLINYFGALTGGAANFRIVGPIAQGRQSFTFDTSTPGQINLIVSGAAANLTWVGDGAANTWNLIGAANWNSGTPDVFYNFDSVLFDDTGSVTPNINLVDTLLPGGITVSNDTKNYTLSGNGKISGSTGLTKLGAGTLTIANSGSNDFTGPISAEGGALVFNQGADTTVANVISGGSPIVKSNGNTLALTGVNTYTNSVTVGGGTLQVNNNASLGAVPGGTVTVAAGATLDVGANATANNANFGAKQITIAGAGPSGNGAIINSGSVAQQNVLQNIVLSGNATFGGPGSFFAVNNPGRWDIRGGTPLLDLAGHKLTKVGTNQISMVSVSVTDGDIDLNAGILSIESISYVTNSGTITVNSNGYFGHFRLAGGSFTRQIVLNGGTFTNLAANGQSSTNDAPISLTAYSVLGSAAGTNSIVLNGSITNAGGSFGFTKVGAGPFELSGVTANTYTGGTTNLGGTLVLSKTSGAAIPAALVIPGGTVTNALNDQIADNAPVTVSGGTLALGPNSDTVGVVTLENGTINGGTLTGSAYNVQNGTINANLAGTGVVMVKTTTNTVILAGVNTYNGGSSINVGALRANVSGSPFGSGGVSVASGAQAYLNAAGIYPNTFSIAGIGPDEVSGNFGALRFAVAGAMTTNTVTLTGNARIGSRGSGAGGILGGPVTGGFALELGNLGDVTSGLLVLSNANNNWTGNTTIHHGTVRLGLSGVIPNSVGAGNVILTNSWTNTASVLDLNGATETVNGLSAVGPDLTLCIITNGSSAPATLAVGDNAASSTFGGVIKAGTGVINLAKVGAGTLTLTAVNPYTGTTTVSNGTLALSGAATIASSTPIMVGTGATLDASGTTFGQLALNSGQTLRGNGTVNGILIVASGATVSPGTSTGRLTVSSPVNLLGGSTTVIELDAANGTNDVLASTISINFNGTLTVTNIGGTLAGGQNYKLFSGALAGNFSGFNFPTLGGGLTWNWNPTTGILSVVGSSVNTTPTNIVSTAAGGNLTMTWPSDHIGWTLQVQTNTRSTGLNTNWFNVSGSAATNQVTVPVNSANPTVFYRLTYP